MEQQHSMKNYPVTIQLPVQWGEMDAFGHVNNVVYFKYFESARIKYFNLLEFGVNNQQIAPILAETKCRFWRPLTYPDNITVGARISSIGNSSFVMEYAIESDKIGLVATGQGLSLIHI